MIRLLGRGFSTRLALVALFALVVRVLYAVLVVRHRLGNGDFFFYNWSADLLAHGHGYQSPGLFASAGNAPATALHPPLWPLLLAAVSKLGGTSAPIGHYLDVTGYLPHRLVGCATGTGLVAVTGLIGRRIAGERAGLVAAGLAAIFPAFIAADADIMPDSLYALAVAVAVLLGLRLRSQPSGRVAFALGVAVGAAALTRSEGRLLIPLLAVPLAWRAPRRVPTVALAIAGAALVLAPWAVRNWIVFDHPVVGSTNEGAVIAGANCGPTYNGPGIGSWNPLCLPLQRPVSEVEQSDRWRHDGVTYGVHHLSRLPVVFAVRALRTWNLYRPRLQARQSGLHPPWLDDLGSLAWYLVLPLAAYGLLLARRRRMPLYVLLAPALAATLTALIGFGMPRLFHAALAPLLVLAAAALMHLHESRARIAAALRLPERPWSGSGPAPAWAGIGAVARGESLAAQARRAFGRVFATRFSRRLGVITAIALAVKLIYVIHFAPQSGVSGDGQFYHYLANVLGGDHGFIRPFDYIESHTYVPTAEHPPLYPLLLSITSHLGWTTWGAHRIVSALIGTCTIPAIGVLGRRVAGERVGLLAAAIATIYPFLLILDGTLYSESLYALTIALALIATYRLIDAPTTRRAVVLGVTIGVAALTRSEALLLLPLLALPAALRCRGMPARAFAIACLSCALVVAPWTIRSSIALHHPVLMSTNLGGLVAGSNCHKTYYGPDTGLWSGACISPRRPEETEAVSSNRWTREGSTYARHHARRAITTVLPIRVGRVWDVYQPGKQFDYETYVESRSRFLEGGGVYFYYPLLVLALGGLFWVRRRGDPLFILIAPALLVTLTALMSYGITRFRAPAEVVIVVLGSVGLRALAELAAPRIPRFEIALRRRGVQAE